MRDAPDYQWTAAMPAAEAKKPLRLPWLRCLLLAAALAVLTVALGYAYRHYMKAAYPMKYAELIHENAEEHGFAPSLIFALVRTESGFDETAVSRANAVGLMQLTEGAFHMAQRNRDGQVTLGMETLEDPETNITYGVYYLKLMRDIFPDSDMPTILAAYNAGQGNVRDWLKDPAYSDDGVNLRRADIGETRHYVKKIPDAQALYQELYGIR